MIRRQGDLLQLAGPATLANITSLLEETRAQLHDGVATIDLGGVTELDSSLLAAALAWLREAKRHNRPLAFANVPQGLTTIARLYGVSELLPVTPQS